MHSTVFVSVESVMLHHKEKLELVHSETLCARRIIKISSGLGKGNSKTDMIHGMDLDLPGAEVQGYLFGRNPGWK